MIFGKKQALIEALGEEREILLNCVEEGVLILDGDLIIQGISRGALDLCKLSKRKLIGYPLSVLPSHLQPLAERLEYLAEVVQRTQMAVTDSISIEERKKSYFDLIAVPKRSQKGVVLFFQDKSNQHKVVEMGKMFVSNASHELRTPITIIQGFAETLQEIGDLPQELYLDILDKIVRNCQRMDKLVKNLLTLADLDSLTSSRFIPCDLKGLLLTCTEMIQMIDPQIEILHQMPDEEVLTLADPDLLELAIMNLMDNARKYCEKPAKIDCRLALSAEELSLEIRDDGPGIPEEALEHIFERFYTVNKTKTRHLGGAGLGLSIVKNIIEKHQGVIEAKSTVGCGTTFTMTLPRMLV